ncbi:hypothetical protein J2T09_003209 [Neorhizobium huautlense]|uniref:DUF3299 domain-containing protein n=2 Tax=Neorhizobium huautlense TaxID=67774 RepID=A0ABT9PVE8_9HYPH|nr:hypothetical protein [Neorhizobium huautlense]
MSKPVQARFNRRQTLQTMGLGLIASLPLLATGTRAQAANSDITFDELYGKVSVLGLEFSEKVKQLNGRKIAMRGFMAPPLKAEAQFFVLTEIPMSICPFCSTDSDWPDNIVVVYLGEKQTFTQPSQTIEVRGKLEMGSWTDPETGFVSLLRIRQAEYATV